ncbi:MAG: (Fe-S)-binding protein [Actinomycetota bacterium]
MNEVPSRVRRHDLERVTLFPTCLVTLVFPTAAESARRILERAGLTVEIAEGAACCGQPAWNSGHVKEARRVAVGALEALADGGDVILCSGSCTTMLAHSWPELFEGTEKAQVAKDVASRAHEFSSFLADDVGTERLGPLRMAKPAFVAYHDSCHMLRGLGIKDAPRRLLGAIEGLEVTDLAAQERCCGFGGTFSIRYPEVSSAMADEKVDDIVTHGAHEVVASDAGCLMQICGRAGARDVSLPGRYIADVIYGALSDGEV